MNEFPKFANQSEIEQASLDNMTELQRRKVARNQRAKAAQEAARARPEPTAAETLAQRKADRLIREKNAPVARAKQAKELKAKLAATSVSVRVKELERQVADLTAARETIRLGGGRGTR